MIPHVKVWVKNRGIEIIMKNRRIEKGQKCTVKKGQYKGEMALLRNRGAPVTDDKDTRWPWFAWIGQELTIVYEDEF